MGRATGIDETEVLQEQPRRSQEAEESPFVMPGEMQRTTLAEHEQAWQALVQRLLAHGGEQLVIPPWGDKDLDAIVAGGSYTDGASARLVVGKPIRCHQNAARLYQKGKGSIATGYALSQDGLWRQHSWVIAADTGRLIETTTKRVGYFGIVIPADEADAWAQDALSVQ